MGEDRCEIALAEPASVGADRQGVLNLALTVELGEVDRFGDLAPHSRGAGGGGLDQPLLGAESELKERDLLT